MAKRLRKKHTGTEHSRAWYNCRLAPSAHQLVRRTGLTPIVDVSQTRSTLLIPHDCRVTHTPL